MENNVNYYYQIIFKKIFAISSKILAEYQNLATLEKSCQKGTQQYIEGFSKLDKLLEEEKRYYEAIQGDNAIINALLKKIAYFNKNAYDFVVSKNNNSLVYTRMSLKLGNYLSQLNINRSIEIFSLFNKADAYSELHFENVLMALITFKIFTQRYPDLVLQDFFIDCKYIYAFMFPYIERNIASNNFELPECVYSIIDFLKYGSNISDEDITNYQFRKFQQIKKYLYKNGATWQDRLFLIFYLNVLNKECNNSLADEMVEVIERANIKNNWKNNLQDYWQNEDITRLIRKITFRA